jgi:hypothetical protein
MPLLEHGMRRVTSRNVVSEWRNETALTPREDRHEAEGSKRSEAVVFLGSCRSVTTPFTDSSMVRTQGRHPRQVIVGGSAGSFEWSLQTVFVDKIK